MSDSGDEEDVILESCSKDERAHIVPYDDSEGELFNMYLPVIQDLRVVIPFKMFEFEVLKAVNVVCNIPCTLKYSKGCQLDQWGN